MRGGEIYVRCRSGNINEQKRENKRIKTNLVLEKTLIKEMLKMRFLQDSSYCRQVK